MKNNLKNVVLISDQSGACVDSILATGLYSIKLLVVPYKKNVESIKEKYGDKIEQIIYFIPDTNEEFQKIFSSDYNLNYKEIELFRSAQLKVYRYNSRFIVDDNTNNNIYYTALKFFLDFFCNNNIDMVFSRILEHGSISDTLIFEIAKSKNIPVYILFMNTGFGKDSLVSILDYNKKEFINIEAISNKSSDYKDLLMTLNTNYSSNSLSKFPFSKLLKKFFSKKNKTFIQCIKWFYEYRIKFYLRNIRYSLKKDLYKIREETSIWQMIKGRIYVTKLKRYYNKISVDDILDENYYFYPLHMEPEASIMVRATMSCQLFIIEQISKTLPKGCFLYIKEHPDQFAAIQLDKYYYKGLSNFRNIDFYKRISKLKNVKLIRIHFPSSALIDKSKAVISIAGSALIESVAKEKPILIFGDGVTCVELLHDSFNITDIKSIQESINKVQDGFKPNYDDFSSIMNNYTLSLNQKDFYGKNDTFIDIYKFLYNK